MNKSINYKIYILAFWEFFLICSSSRSRSGAGDEAAKISRLGAPKREAASQHCSLAPLFALASGPYGMDTTGTQYQYVCTMYSI